MGRTERAGSRTIAGTIFARTGQGLTVIDSEATGALTASGYGGDDLRYAGPTRLYRLRRSRDESQHAVPVHFPVRADHEQSEGFGNQTRNQYRGPWILRL